MEVDEGDCSVENEDMEGKEEEEGGPRVPLRRKSVGVEAAMG